MVAFNVEKVRAAAGGHSNARPGTLNFSTATANPRPAIPQFGAQNHRITHTPCSALSESRTPCLGVCFGETAQCPPDEEEEEEEEEGAAPVRHPEKKPSIASHRSTSQLMPQLASPLTLSPQTGRPPGGSPVARRTDSVTGFERSTRSSRPSMPHLRARARLWNRSRPGRTPCRPKPRCCQKINTPCLTARRRDTARASTVRPYPPYGEPRWWLRSHSVGLADIAPSRGGNCG